MKKLMKLFIAIAMTITMLTGCSSKKTEEYTTAKEVVEAYVNKMSDNAKMHLEVLTNTSYGEGNEMPMKVTVNSMQIGSIGYMETTYAVTVYGMEMQSMSATYFNEENMYTITDDEDQWYVSKLNTDALAMAENYKLNAEDFENATLVKTDDGYTVSMALADYLEKNATFDNLVGNVDAESMEGLVVNYYFDQDCILTSIHMGETTITYNVGEIAVKITMALDLATDFDTVKEEDITIPQDVIDNAIEAEETPAGESGYASITNDDLELELYYNGETYAFASDDALCQALEKDEWNRAEDTNYFSNDEEINLSLAGASGDFEDVEDLQNGIYKVQIIADHDSAYNIGVSGIMIGSTIEEVNAITGANISESCENLDVYTNQGNLDIYFYEGTVCTIYCTIS